MSRQPTVAQIEPVGGHGGMHYYNLGLAQGLVQAGVRILLFTSSRGGLSGWPEDGLHSHETFAGCYGDTPRWLRGWRFVSSLARALNSARRQNADLVHLHFFGASSTERLSLHLAQRWGFPTVVTVHDIDALGGAAESHPRRIYSRPEALVVHNETCHRALRPFAPTTPIEVVPHGHYLHVVGRMDRRQARRRLGLSAAAPTALFFGQIKRSKGLDLLIESMRGVVDRLPDARLVIAGRAWRDEVEIYRDAIQRSGLDEAVDFRHGFVSEADVPALFGAADLVVLPYRRIYQSGVLLMAMSYGRAVLTSDLPAMREVVDDGVNGFTFHDGDATHLALRLTELLQRPESLAAAAETALERLRVEHDWRLIGERTASLYRRLSQ